MEILQREIEHCLIILEKGGTLLYPTDTIWGIGCDATNPMAVERVFRIKRRDDSKSLIILLDDAGKIGDYVEEVPGPARKMVASAASPLTIIYPGAKNLADNVMAEDRSVAIRVVKHDFCRELIRKFGKPIVSTSANISGENYPAGFAQISPEIKNSVDHVVDEIFCNRDKVQPSKIIKIEKNGEITVIRG